MLLILFITETTRASPRLNTKVSRPSSTHESKEGYTPKHDIVVVAEGAPQEPSEDTELTRLDEIPVFLPLLRGSLTLPGGLQLPTQQILQQPEIIEKLDVRHLQNLVSRYQEHLRQCAEAVSFDQNALCVRIKEVTCCFIFI